MIKDQIPVDVSKYSDIINVKGEGEILKECPLCKSGVRYFFVDFHVKMLMCENTKCEYPFGSDDFHFINADNDMHLNNDSVSVMSYGTSVASCSQASTTAALAEIEKMNKICEASYIHEYVNKYRDKTFTIQNKEKEILQNVQEIRQLNSTLNDLEKTEEKLYIKNEKWVKNLFNLQELSRVRLLKQEEIDLVNKKEQTSAASVKIDIDTETNNGMSSIKIELAKGRNID